MMTKLWLAGGSVVLALLAIQSWRLGNALEQVERLSSELDMAYAVNRAADTAITAKEQFRREIAKSLQEKREKLAHVDDTLEDDGMYIGNLLDALGVYRPAGGADETGFAPEPAVGREPNPAGAGGAHAQ